MKIIPMFILFIVIIFISCSNNRSNSLREAVLLSFDCLKNIQKKDFEYYRDRMVTFEDCKVIFATSKIPDSIRIQLKDSMTNEKLLIEQEQSFNELRKSALEYNLICKDFQYIDYISENKTKNGVEGFEGTLHFFYKGEIYLTDFIVVKIQNKYKVVVLENLRPKNPNNDED